jgi:hypothetical protein
MAKLNLSQAAKVTGKNRTTIWRHIHSGKLSIERDRDGLPFVDTSELIRVYGELEPIATGEAKKKPHQATRNNEDLIAVIDQLRKEQGEMRKEQAEMKQEISILTNRLSYTPHKESLIDTNQLRAEDDPDWPKEVKELSDITLRNEIKKRYKAQGN